MTTLNQSIDLWELVDRDTTLKKVADTKKWGVEYAGPCPFCGNGDDRFRVWPNHPSGYCQFWCRVCNRGGGGTTYLMARDNLSYQQVKRDYKGYSYTPAVNTPTVKSKIKPRVAKTPTDNWRQSAQTIVDTAISSLWSAQGSVARSWLHERGLTDATIITWRLGYIPTAGKQRGLYCHSGVTIPWVDGAGRLWAVKIATGNTEQGKKYRAVSESSFAGSLFGVDKLTGKADCFVTEGEFDAILLHQEIGDCADVLTLGAADGCLADRWLTALLPIERLWIATDNDDKGEDAARYWLELVGDRGRRVYPPMGEKDVTDAFKVGADLRAWALAHISELTSPPLPEPELFEPELSPELIPDLLPDWHGQIMPIADLAQFKVTHGLRVVSSSWNGNGAVMVEAQS